MLLNLPSLQYSPSSLTSVDEIRFIPFSNSTRATQFSREAMKTQGDWEFVQLTVSGNNFTFNDRQWEQIIYTVRTRLNKWVENEHMGSLSGLIRMMWT